jgi:hypothetical protein
MFLSRSLSDDQIVYNDLDDAISEEIKTDGFVSLQFQMHNLLLENIELYNQISILKSQLYVAQSLSF